MLGRLILTIAILFAWMGLGYAQEADTSGAWTECDVSVFERINGEFAPEPSISILNYNANKGLGLYVGRDRSAGPLASWRVWWGTLTWLQNVKVAFHVIASTDLAGSAVDGYVFDNGTSGLGMRVEIAKGAEVAGKLLWTFMDGEKAQFTPAIGLVFRPL